MITEVADNEQVRLDRLQPTKLKIVSMKDWQKRWLAETWHARAKAH